MDIKKILAEDARRRARVPAYDPVAGDPGRPGMVSVSTPVPGLPRALVPKSMTEDPAYRDACRDSVAWRRLRCHHDFEYWCATCVTVRHKTRGEDVRLVLNAPQRRLARALESQLVAGRPLRAIILKARQWGGSTLVQAYMAWIQTCRRLNWHSIICSQVKDTSAGIRGMFAKILENYPAELWDGDVAPAFTPYERSGNVRVIKGRGCRVTVSSVENQDAVRGADFAMAHLSEVAYWRATPGHSPGDVIRAICGSVPMIPESLTVMESTANGVGNFFHREWLRSEQGLDGRLAIFVPWYEIEYYRLEPPSREDVAATFTPRERQLWDAGCDLDQIYWYRCKLAELGSEERMMSEFPSTATEAFISTGRGIFPREAVELLARDCREAVRGEVIDGCWKESRDGTVELWQKPCRGAFYVVAVDIGGRSSGADFSVIAVMRHNPGSRHEVVAQWRGHCYHDVLADRAMALASFYNEALLVVESNSLESGAGAGYGMYILERLAEYPRLYRRRVYGDAGREETSRIGFHTNRATKEMIISGLLAAVRDATFIEHDRRAIDELLRYEQRPDGSYGACDGAHDDIVMTRAIAMHVLNGLKPVPAVNSDTSMLPW